MKLNEPAADRADPGTHGQDLKRAENVAEGPIGNAEGAGAQGEPEGANEAITQGGADSGQLAAATADPIEIESDEREDEGAEFEEEEYQDGEEPFTYVWLEARQIFQITLR